MSQEQIIQKQRKRKRRREVSHRRESTIISQMHAHTLVLHDVWDVDHSWIVNHIWMTFTHARYAFTLKILRARACPFSEERRSTLCNERTYANITAVRPRDSRVGSSRNRETCHFRPRIRQTVPDKREDFLADIDVRDSCTHISRHDTDFFAFLAGLIITSKAWNVCERLRESRRSLASSDRERHKLVHDPH